MTESGRYAEEMAARAKKKKQRVHVVFKVRFGRLALPEIVSVYANRKDAKDFCKEKNDVAQNVTHHYFMIGKEVK